MADKVIFQGGDDLDETNLAEATARSNQTDYVVRGLGFTADFNNDTLDIGSGFAIIETSNNEAYHVYPDKRTGLSLSASTTNHVFLEIDETTDDSIDYHIDTADSAPSNPSLKLGTVDTSNDTTTEINRDPDVSAETLDANRETFVRATRGSQSSSITSGSFTNIADGESKDVRSEFDENSNARFNPDSTQFYHIIAIVAFEGSSSAGDRVAAKIRNVDGNANTSKQPQLDLPTSGSEVEFTFLVELDAGTNYEVQAANFGSSFKTGTASQATIMKQVVHP